MGRQFFWLQSGSSLAAVVDLAGRWLQFGPWWRVCAASDLDQGSLGWVGTLNNIVGRSGERRVAMIQVISLRGRGGVRPVGVYVGRPSPLGNPFVIGRDGTRAEVVATYRAWLRRQWRQGGPVRDELERLVAQYRRDRQLTLLCWRAPRPCHADVIREAVLGIYAKEVR